MGDLLTAVSSWPRQLYDLMLPVIFTVGMYGARLNWKWTRKVRARLSTGSQFAS